MFSARLEPLSADTAGATGGNLGKLRWISGVRLSADDPRFRDIRGLEYDSRFGLLAVTAGRDWLDLRLGRALGKEPAPRSTEIGIAPMVMAPGEPGPLINDGYGVMTVNFGGDRFLSYDLGGCGLASKPAEWMNESAGIARDYAAKAAPIPGWRLVSFSEVDRFVPDLRPGTEDIYLLWRPADGGKGAILQHITNDGSPPYTASEVARIDRPVVAMIADYAQEVRVVLAIQGPTPESLDIDYFAVKGTARR